MILTGSGLDRADACPGSLALPQRPHDTADSESGRDVHAFLDDAAKRGRARALGAIEDSDLLARCEAIDLDAIPAGADSEVALAYDPENDTAERLQLAAHRAYPDDGRIMMTLDRVGVLDGAAWVGDFKTGKAGMRAQDTLQIRAGCLAVSRLVGTEEAAGALLYLRHDGRWTWDRASFDSLDLDEIRQQLLDIRARVAGARRVVERGGLPELVPGPHCTHCAAAVECPAQERQQAQLARIEPATLTEWIGALSPERRGAFTEQVVVVKKLAEKARAALRLHVLEHGPIDLPSGRRLAQVQAAAPILDDHAREELARLCADLREAGHITSGTTSQVRVVGRAKKR